MRDGQRTNISSAVGDAFFSGGAILAVSVFRFCMLRVAFGSRNGFRDTGRGRGSSKGEAGLWRLGDTARLRKGLLDDRLSSNPADGWSSGDGANSQPTLSQVRTLNRDKTGGVHVYDDCKKVDETANLLNMTQQAQQKRVEGWSGGAQAA